MLDSFSVWGIGRLHRTIRKNEVVHWTHLL